MARDELETLVSCLACDGQSGDSPSLESNEYRLAGCRWCRGPDERPTGTMTPAQVARWRSRPRGTRMP